MRTKTTAFIAVICAMVGSSAHSDCGTDVWTVTVDEASMTVEPKDLEVCNGDIVTWETTGTSNFNVIFAVGGPPGSPARGDGTYSVTISANPGNYPYDVKINGVSLDPMIIIRR
jgi:plastocyanin